MHEEELSSNIQLSDRPYLRLMLTDYDWEWSRTWPLNKKENDADLEVNHQAFGSFLNISRPQMIAYTYVWYIHMCLCRLSPANLKNQPENSPHFSVFCITEYCELDLIHNFQHTGLTLEWVVYEILCDCKQCTYFEWTQTNFLGKRSAGF